MSTKTEETPIEAFSSSELSLERDWQSENLVEIYRTLGLSFANARKAACADLMCLSDPKEKEYCGGVRAA